MSKTTKPVAEIEELPAVAKKRGRPKKEVISAPIEEVTPEPKKRGRPKKEITAVAEPTKKDVSRQKKEIISELVDAIKEEIVEKKRGRPKKAANLDLSEDTEIKDLSYGIGEVISDELEDDRIPSDKKRQKIVEVTTAPMVNSVDKTLWSELLEANVAIREIDHKLGTVKLHITKTIIMDIENANELRLIDFGDTVGKADKYAKLKMDEQEHLFVLSWRKFKPMDNWGVYFGKHENAGHVDDTKVYFVLAKKNG